MIKKLLKIFFSIVCILAAIVIIYISYCFISYYRVDDNLKVNIESESEKNTITVGDYHRIVSANLGFGAYSDDYSFFMDGGTESWAFSKDAVIENITGSIDNILTLDPEIMLLQEIDIDSTRSYHVNEKELIYDVLARNNSTGFSFSYAQNYDSPFLLYPLTQPHGHSEAGIVSASKFQIQSSVRRSLPIETGFSKFIDLDRCYCKNYIDTDNGKQLVIINAHLSAYTTDPSTAENQVIMLNEDIKSEVAKGNYVIVGGDMNKDLLGDSTKYFKSKGISDNWASPFPVELLDDEFSVIAPIDESYPVPSCRNANEPLDDDTFRLTIDGFIISSNIEAVYSNVLDSGFKYSDHNPVYMDFILK